MVVTRGAARGQAEESRAKRLHAVAGLVHVDFLGDRAAFVGRGIAAHETGRRQLVEGARRQQIAGELLPHKRVEALVPVEGADHVVAIRPDRPVVVEVDAVRVRVAHVVEPVTRAVLPVARTRQQPVDHPLVGIGRPVRDKGRHVLRRRHNAREIKRHAADERAAIRLRRRREPILGEARDDEGVDRVAHRFRLRLGHRGHGGTPRRNERPVLLIGRALGDPPAQRGDVLRLEGLVPLGGRHDFLFVFRFDALNQRTFLRFARDDRRIAVLALRRGKLPPIQPELGLARASVNAMAGVAVLRENGLDVRVERKLGRSGRGRTAGRGGQHKRRGAGKKETTHRGKD